MHESQVTFVGCRCVPDGCPRSIDFAAPLEMKILQATVLHGMDATWMWQCRYLTHHECSAHLESDSLIVVRGSGGTSYVYAMTMQTLEGST
jgi:hypothetical protein